MRTIKYSKPVNINETKADALIVYCSDFRFQDQLHEVAKSFGVSYDLIAFGGASKAITDKSDVRELDEFLHSIHNYDQVMIFDHIRCGAFGPVEDEVRAHAESFSRASDVIQHVRPGTPVSGFLFGVESAVEISYVPLNQPHPELA